MNVVSSFITLKTFDLASMSSFLCEIFHGQIKSMDKSLFVTLGSFNMLIVEDNQEENNTDSALGLEKINIESKKM